MDQLENSVERSEGGSGATVEYMVYLTPTNVKTFYARDFDKGRLVKNEMGEAIYFELYKKGTGEEQETLVIQLQSVSYMELTTEQSKGKTKFKYKFYY